MRMSSLFLWAAAEEQNIVEIKYLKLKEYVICNPSLLRPCAPTYFIE